MKVRLDVPYPEVRVEKGNAFYADLLSQDYAGKTSETTAILLYSYQHFDKFESNKDFAKIIEEIAIVEMKHLEILGKTIKLLGKTPAYKTCESSRGDCIMWDAENVNYETELKKMIKLDIESEKKAIRTYEHHKKIIDDKYIKNIIERIIMDEKNHLKIFEEMYNELKIY